jgi:hypothetical protein
VLSVTARHFAARNARERHSAAQSTEILETGHFQRRARASGGGTTEGGVLWREMAASVLRALGDRPHNTLMPTSRYHGRRAAVIENGQLRVTMLESGGHIAEVADKRTGVNPLWMPPWPSIDPAAYEPSQHRIYGGGIDGSLLAGIMGHNLCLDIFGGPSPEEAAAGMPVHGEVSVTRFEFSRAANTVTAFAELPLASLRLEREIALAAGVSGAVRIRESVLNLSGIDKPIGWTEHVTLGPPFLQKGATEFRASATRSKVFPRPFGDRDYLIADAEFDWPNAPRSGGGTADLRTMNGAQSSSAYTAHLMDQSREHAFFAAFTPELRTAFGYVWRRADFPWLGIWEENNSRTGPPWNGATVTRGLEFGVSPFPETRREMIDRNRLFGVPTYRWVPAAGRVTVEYWIVIRPAEAIPETLDWPGE